MPENLLRASWAGLDQADLRLLLAERIGRHGQSDGQPKTLYLPLARDQCRVGLKFRGSEIIAIERGPAFDAAEWERICTEIETSVLNGPVKVGRDISFSSFRVKGWWRGARSGVQILPPPDDAPRARVEMADHPFLLEFPIQEGSIWGITNYHRMREHRRLTLLLNLLLAGSTSLLSTTRQTKHFWAIVRHHDDHPLSRWVEPFFRTLNRIWPSAFPVRSAFKTEWVQRCYFTNFGQAVSDEISSPSGEKLGEVEPNDYYTRVHHDGEGLRVPTDLDDSICRYLSLSSKQRVKFDRATYWMHMSSGQWENSMSASFASLVSSVEALTERGTTHTVYCEECKQNCQHDVPGATANFRSFLDTYAPGASLEPRRSEMYQVRSKILHGSELMQFDQDLVFGWDPPWRNERELYGELSMLVRVASRNWLINPPGE